MAWAQSKDDVEGKATTEHFELDEGTGAAQNKVAVNKRVHQDEHMVVKPKKPKKMNMNISDVQEVYNLTEKIPKLEVGHPQSILCVSKILSPLLS